MGFNAIAHVVVLSAFIIATILALLSVMLDDAMKEFRGFNGIFAYLFLLVGGGAAIRSCINGISNATGSSFEDIRGFIGFLFETLPVAIIILAAIGLGIWCVISSKMDKKKKEEETNDKNSTLH